MAINFNKSCIAEKSLNDILISIQSSGRRLCYFEPSHSYLAVSSKRQYNDIQVTIYFDIHMTYYNA